ncbi:hypothetical protein MLD38_021868 [Melastoma candidum]|uniref:Uncharacterized protein n=1 Tax=Melastoma candidum TaxID=119954 RepID=A0ACB9QHX3_9MYRT|nr:hypothetical protein MLD38_021868 [Melastoma candidum]
MDAKKTSDALFSHQDNGVNVDDLRQGILMTSCRGMCFLAGKSDNSFRKLRKQIESWTVELELSCDDDEGKKTDDDGKEYVFTSSKMRSFFGNPRSPKQYGVNNFCDVNPRSEGTSEQICNDNSVFGVWNM